MPCQFDGGEALDYTGAYWNVQQGELWGVIDPSGRWMLPARYQQIHAYEGYYSAKPPKGPQHLFTLRFHDLGAPCAPESPQIIPGARRAPYDRS